MSTTRGTVARAPEPLERVRVTSESIFCEVAGDPRPNAIANGIERPEAGQKSRPAARERKAKERRSPLGRRIRQLVRGEGDAPAASTLAWLEQSGTDDAKALVSALREAMVQRDARTGDLLPAPIRDVEAPHARLVLALWLCVAESCRGRLANSRGLWLGHDRAGLRGGLAGRLGGLSRFTVGRMLDALEASGALKRWQAPQHTAGVVRGLEHGHAYHLFVVRVLPRELAFQVRLFYVRAKRTAPTVGPAVASPPPQSAGPTEAPSAPPTKPSAASSSEAPSPARWAAAYDRDAALAKFGALFPSGPPPEAP